MHFISTVRHRNLLLVSLMHDFESRLTHQLMEDQYLTYCYKVNSILDSEICRLLKRKLMVQSSGRPRLEGRPLLFERKE